MEIKGFIDLSLVDWYGKVSSVIFLPHCNFRCPFCYNSSLVISPEKEETIPFEQIQHYLSTQKGWIDGVCITGGEPTLHTDLLDLCSNLKDLGFLVKLDTNGTNPLLLNVLIEKKLIDYVALDIKAPLTVHSYSKITGVDSESYLLDVKKTIHLLLQSEVDYEFRTTVVPTLHTPQDLQEIGLVISGCKQYFIQRFIAKTETIDPAFSTLTSFSDTTMGEFLVAARKFVFNTQLR